MIDYQKIFDAIDMIHKQALLAKTEEPDDFNYGLLKQLDHVSQQVLWHITRGEKGEKSDFRFSLDGPFSKKQMEMMTQHGTPAQFAEAVYKAVPGFISMDEARASVEKYNKEWSDAS